MEEQVMPVSQRAVAEALGISQTTVSMALAGSPRVAEATREAVRAMAEKLAYRPDPTLRALARYRKAVGPVHYQATLAWVHAWPAERAWRESAVFDAFHDEVEARAQRLGYRLENFWLHPRLCSGARATCALLSRGIRGLLLLPGCDYTWRLELDWGQFCAVRCLHHGAQGPAVNAVSADHYEACLTTLRELEARGYRRPALVTEADLERSMNHGYVSAYAGWQALPRARSLPSILWYEGLDKEGFAAWLEKERPDALMLSYVTRRYGQIFEWLQELGHRIPEDIGVCMLCLPDAAIAPPAALPPRLAGVDEGLSTLAERAVDFLVQQVEQLKVGLPRQTSRLLVRGDWRDGATLRARISA